ncbi:PqqD family protein [Synechococcus sp. Cruz-9H2]|uniref:PqqD family protein n=1 Tax=unclassified Synechococcus TaxID=2626047 RepID=UPI0020CED199|nr:MULTISPECIES: PqqD family protein [unclassified Synechococcus]MCP9818862.1 PqqD family protein [Synechococcus sp. Cruz-9H2]MCP9843365.1 PqqD family protein [Synechococcus sp. Edmonson 11F2]MCP9855252.1 PqqD family protein [Synechococcus sp. Cruz-9C9]MCP9862775.1 PqqD family protein [Synechococcus sp. Cruz-7E5]MCP9869772.1 PqqD family protein [Synechococcus sp. Cruz-7B9]
MTTTQSHAALTINADKVAHETIEDEVIIIHLETGTYYNLVDVGRDVWLGLEVGVPSQEIVKALSSAYGVAPELAGEAVEALLASLLAEEILVAADSSPASIEPFKLSDRTGCPFTTPELTIHTNMADLLMLDPIHDVDEQGWPSASPQDRAL